MSKFYHALKEASRFRPDANGSVGDGAAEESTGNGIDLPLASLLMAVPEAVLLPVTVAETVEAQESARVAPAAIPTEEPWVVSAKQELLPSVDISRNGTLGVPARIIVDRKARLLPNAVNPAVVEHYRRLRTKIVQQQQEQPFRKLVVTSPNPREGKTVTVLNLGLSFGMLPDFKILVIDGDLRRGTLGEWIGAGEQPGLSNLLDGTAQMEEVVLKAADIPMHFIVRGTSKVPSSELLHSANVRTHLDKLAQYFDLILVDSPPVNLITDVQLLAGSCDAVLLIARAFSTTRKAFENAVKDLQPFRLIGTVLNAGTKTRPYGRYDGYY